MTNLIRRAISARAKFQHLRIRLNEQRLGSPAGPLSVEFIDWLPGFRRLLRLLFLSSVSVHRRFFRRAVSKPRRAIQFICFMEVFCLPLRAAREVPTPACSPPEQAA